MSIFNDKALKGVAEAVSKIMDEELKGNQHKIDANKNGKIDGQDFKILRAKKNMKEEEELDEASYSAKAARAGKDIGKPGKEFSKIAKSAGERYGSAESGKKVAGAILAKLRKEETELDEAFPTVDDAKKRMAAGKTATGTVTKTKTGLVHKRDYKDDDNDADDAQKKPKGYGARQNFKRSTRVNEQKLSFTEMLQLYNEAGVEVISKIVPQTVKFGDTEVELIDANIVNGAVGITVAEEVDNETFTKEVEAQKAKNAGGGKKAEVAKASVQAVKQEEVEQLDEINKHSFVGKIMRHHELKKKVDSSWKPIGDAQRAGDHKAASKAFRKHVRYTNLERPGTWRDVKEEVEQLDEKLPASASAGDYIHDFVHSDNPKFAGKSTKERQKMALGAFYAKNKGK